MHTPPGRRVSPTLFNSEHSKIGLNKIQRIRRNNFGARGSNVAQLSTWGAARQAQPLAGRTHEILEGKKRPKFGAIFDNFRLWSRISPERMKTSISGKRCYQLRSLPRSTKKNGELWSTNHRAYAANVYPPKINTALMHLRSGHVTLLRGKFKPPYLSPHCRTYCAGRHHVWLCPVFLVFSALKASFAFVEFYYAVIRITGLARPSVCLSVCPSRANVQKSKWVWTFNIP